MFYSALESIKPWLSGGRHSWYWPAAQKTHSTFIYRAPEKVARQFFSFPLSRSAELYATEEIWKFNKWRAPCGRKIDRRQIFAVGPTDATYRRWWGACCPREGRSPQSPARGGATRGIPAGTPRNAAHLTPPQCPLASCENKISKYLVYH